MEFPPVFHLSTKRPRLTFRYKTFFISIPQTKNKNNIKVNSFNYNVIQMSPMAMEDGQAADRQTWGNPVEFLMSCIAMSVGLGN
jgi:hypothetical protein